ncbi:type II, N4M-methylcytosine DNA methyltransferase (group beta) [Staphylococcus phage vB_SauH_SPJ2]|nr:type II, N4M-methylcytosine DNA methyltransferase (group beta) [Staphylococcus phage LSA2308]USZ62925.1 DNA methylase family protein [Staphylococcus phage LSA2311]WEW53667.1 type II, N4M-methylcytosine DNA methyltransferase (group beta) [Staphylococcus phage vB_SauH_SPJ2]
MELELNKIYNEDCLEGMKKIPDNSIDLIVTDPPLHQNEKPLDLIKQCIMKHSNKGDVVLDGFIGSGTTAIACMSINRNYIGFELDEEYYNLASERIEKHKEILNNENDNTGTTR